MQYQDINVNKASNSDDAEKNALPRKPISLFGNKEWWLPNPQVVSTFNHQSTNRLSPISPLTNRKPVLDIFNAMPDLTAHPHDSYYDVDSWGESKMQHCYTENNYAVPSIDWNEMVWSDAPVLGTGLNATTLPWTPSPICTSTNSAYIDGLVGAINPECSDQEQLYSPTCSGHSVPAFEKETKCSWPSLNSSLGSIEDGCDMEIESPGCPVLDEIDTVAGRDGDLIEVPDEAINLSLIEEPREESKGDAGIKICSTEEDGASIVSTCSGINTDGPDENSTEVDAVIVEDSKHSGDAPSEEDGWLSSCSIS